MKKFLSVILIAIITILPLTVVMPCFMINSQAAEIDFKCGENATWSLDEYGVLTISGTGDIYDFVSRIYYEAPWNEFRSSIKKVVIEESITNIGQNAFQDCYSATDLHVSSSVEVVESRNVVATDTVFAIFYKMSFQLPDNRRQNPYQPNP